MSKIHLLLTGTVIALTLSSCTTLFNSSEERIDINHRSKQYLQLAVSGQSDFFVTVTAAVDIEGEYEIMSSWHLSLSNLYRIKRFSIGYGLSFSRNTWAFRYSSFGESSPPGEKVGSTTANSFLKI